MKTANVRDSQGRRARALLSAQSIASQDVDIIFDELLDNETTAEIYLVDEISGTDLNATGLLSYCAEYANMTCSIDLASATRVELRNQLFFGSEDLIRSTTLLNEADITDAVAAFPPMEITGEDAIANHIFTNPHP